MSVSQRAFVKYNSLENHYQRKAVQAFAKHVPKDELCYLTEKVHGANVQIFVSDDGLRIARRTDFLAPNENFNSVQKIVDSMQEQFRKVLRLARVLISPDVEEVSVCAEVFGGEYPGLKSTVSRVQKGVFYSNDCHLYAFDLRLFYKGKEYTAETDPAPYAEWNEFCTIMDDADIFRAQALATMFAEDVCNELTEHNKLLAHDPKFLSTIPGRLGHHEIPNNWSEGYVIRPRQSHFDDWGNRMIFKYKNPDFSEVAHAPAPTKEKDDTLEKQWISVVQEFFDDKALRNRLANVLSKESSWDLTDNKIRSQIIKALATDVADDVTKTYGDLLDHKKLSKKIYGECGKFIVKVVSESK